MSRDNTQVRHVLTPAGWKPMDMHHYNFALHNGLLESNGLKEKDRTRFKKWCSFHRDNPHVFRLFKRFAGEALNAGHKVGARMITERIRWYSLIETSSNDYKINDHHTPYYARLLMGLDERFDGFFRLKDSKFDSSIEEIVDYHRSI